MAKFAMMPVLIIFILMFSGVRCTSFLNWLWPSSEKDESKPNSDAPLIKVPFEALPDEKFLEEAKKYSLIKFSELDSCTQKVVMKIRSSCSEMSEEDLGKTSVHLLNCQSAAEGRREYPCTETMSLRQCTTLMDSDTWNAYLLVSNRARAVCYASRQQQFRALSEMTVNKLMAAAHQQLEAMNSLKDSQSKISSITDMALEKMQQGHQMLLNQQEELQVSQHSLQGFVANNLRELTREKSLIASGHREVSKFFSNIKSQFDSAKAQFSELGLEQRQNHDNLISLLNDYQDKLNAMWLKIERSTDELMDRHMETAKQYDIVLEKLSKINDTVNFLHGVTSETRKSIDDSFQWILKLAGSTSDHLEILYDCILHICFLIAGMIALPFLKAPFISRVCLVAIVVLNWVTYSYFGKENTLNFVNMAMVVFCSTLFNWIVWATYLMCNVGQAEEHDDPQPAQNSGFTAERKFVSDRLASLNIFWSRAVMKIKKMIFGSGNRAVYRNPSASGSRIQNEGSRATASVRQNHRDSDSEGESVGSFHTSRTSQPISSQFAHHDRPIGVVRRRESYRASQTPLRAVTPNSPPGSCEAICVSGTRCKMPAASGYNLCRRHLTYVS